MPKKEWTDEERKAFADKMKAARNKAVDLPKDQPDIVASDQDLDELKAQMKELMESNMLLKAAFLNQNNQSGLGMSRTGQLVGEVEKYVVDPTHYPDPVARLRAEPRLIPLAFDYNYELAYKVDVTSYETKSGVNTKEPKFTVSLRRIMLDDQGAQTNRGYHIQSYVFHEDPQTAMILARENGLDVKDTEESTFLNEMRYLRVRDWLFNCFWPKKELSAEDGVREEVIGGKLVQVYTRSSIDSTGVDFDQIKTKM